MKSEVLKDSEEEIQNELSVPGIWEITVIRQLG